MTNDLTPLIAFLLAMNGVLLAVVVHLLVQLAKGRNS